MTDPSYNIRNYQPADFNSFTLLYMAAEEREPTGRPATPQAVNEKLSHPGITPENDIFIVEAAGVIIGFADILHEPGIERVVADCWLLPEHRGRGLGRKILKAITRRAGELGAGCIHVSIRNDNIAGKNILPRLGFRFIRRFLELTLDISKLKRDELDDAAQGCRHLREGEEELLAQVQNRSFAGQWGYDPNTAESIAYRFGQSHRSPEDVAIVCEEDKFVGYCWTEITGKGQGGIYMIGSDPDYRGQGIGRKTLLAGLARLRNKGINSVSLTVDSENKAACSLYESVGFEQKQSYLWYEMAVD
jgi:mycothiol synthase